MTAPNFQINNNRLPDPTDLTWVPAETKGIDGFGNKRYDPYFAFELKWNFLSETDYFSGVYRLWQGHYLSGSANVILPKYNGAQYEFQTYSGTVIDRPEIGGYVNNFVKDVKLTIRKIRVE